MERRVLGRTGLSVSALGLGGGAVGGLMVRGSAADQERALGVAFDAGITFIDTAPSYGDGASETNLGRALGRVAAGRPNLVLATKFTIPSGADRNLGSLIEESLHASLRRLGRERIDVLQLHNAIGSDAAVPSRSLDPARVIEEVAPALERLRAAGKIGWFGITAIGERDALHAVIDSGRFQTAQVPFNLLNPTADGVLPRAAAAGLGTIGIRALAGGALSGSEWRHPIGMAEVAPIGTGATYADDVAAVGRFRGLVDGGWAGSLAEAALRFAVFSPSASTVLVGVSTVEQLQDAIAAAERGPLAPEAIALVERVWSALPGS